MGTDQHLDLLSRFQAITESTIDAIISIDQEGKILSWNSAAEKLFGFKEKEAIGEVIEIIIPNDFVDAHRKGLQRIVKGGKPHIIGKTVELMGKKKDGSHFPIELSLSTWESGSRQFFSGIIRDITERKESERSLLESELKFRSITETANDAVISADQQGLIISWNNAARKIFGYNEGEVIGQPLTIIIPEKFREAHQQGMARVIPGGKKKVIGKTVELLGLRKNGTEFPIELSLSTWESGSRHFFCGIIRDITERKVAEMALKKSEQKLKNQAKTLQEAYEVIKNQNERMEDELRVGREIQMSMVPCTFPAFPERDEFSVYAKLKPARELGGDFYDFYFVDGRRFFFCIGDVSGKGVPAALFMAVTKTLIESRTVEDYSTASIMTHINDELSKDNSSCMFVTLFAGILDVTAGEFIYTNAGHNPPYLRRRNGSLERIDQRHGPIAGAMPGIVYGEAHALLSPGDLLMLYTDGVTEAMNFKNELFSEERLVEILKDGGLASPHALVDKTVAAVEMFEQGTEQADDVTVLAIQFLAASDQTGIADRFTVGSHLSGMSVVQCRLDDFAARSRLPEATTSKLHIVLDELISNIINYGYTDDAKHKIEVNLELVGHQLVMTIADDGIPFNPLTVEPPDTNAPLLEREVGGLGIHLVRNLVDEVTYQRRVNRNILTLVTRLAPQHLAPVK